MRWHTTEQIASIPMRQVGPVKIISAEVNEAVFIPLATLETPLWPSTQRGAMVCSRAGGISVVIVDERMTRSILLEARSASAVYQAWQKIQNKKEILQQVVSESSRYARLLDMHAQVVGTLLYLRFEFSTGDAAGHNMVTLAADHLLNWIVRHYPELSYVSISGNYCTDKKNSAVNGILGRGKNVIAEVTLSRALCRRFLKTTPEAIVQLNVKKNLLGSIVAGGVRTANAHFANVLLGFYLATGQDVANIVEGSQGIVYAEARADNLYFSVTVPHLIVGTVGNGKGLTFVQENLRLLGCLEKRAVGQNARRLAVIGAAAILCAELSLLAAQSKPGELMKSHLQLERQK
ncbi:MAG: hydroxymethylglutaryl-CoA reductase [Gammaproteobacteria bacterium RIFCSPHIGHO2_12_FULL_41_20]|nr:MAG: hydroxymethylglutaryl-CoA reductase [Gammaproteobacteria bacterium RIFCSPHIGHO2_12_FULL_41_20]